MFLIGNCVSGSIKIDGLVHEMMTDVNKQWATTTGKTFNHRHLQCGIDGFSMAFSYHVSHLCQCGNMTTKSYQRRYRSVKMVDNPKKWLWSCIQTHQENCIYQSTQHTNFRQSYHGENELLESKFGFGRWAQHYINQLQHEDPSKERGNPYHKFDGGPYFGYQCNSLYITLMQILAWTLEPISTASTNSKNVLQIRFPKANWPENQPSSEKKSQDIDWLELQKKWKNQEVQLYTQYLLYCCY